MQITVVILAVLMSLAMGWSIGANDAANSMGTAVGSRVLTLRQAIALIAVFGLLGALLQGGSVTKMIGKGIVPLCDLDREVATWVAMAATLSSCLWIAAATFWRIPVSTSHGVVGAVAGCGLAIGAPIYWKVLGDIFICWLLTPVGAAVLGFLFYSVLKRLLPFVVPERHTRRVLTFLIIASGCYVAYSWGANDVANATGILCGTHILPGHWSVLLGGLAIVVGIATWGYKVIETIGSRITHLLPLMAFAAQLASAVNVHVYTVFGIPVSTSHSIVGAIFGVGLGQGVRMVNVRVLREIAVCWVATPFACGLFGYMIMKLVGLFLDLG